MRKLLADTSISNNPKIIEELKKAGWKSTTAYRQEKGTRCYQFGVLYRFENSSVLKQTSSSKRVTDKQVTHYTTGKTAENKAFEAGSNLTMGNPYATTHVTRPFDMGKYEPEEHPFTGIGRMIAGIGEVKKAVPEMVIFGSAPTYLRQFADLYTAGAVEEGFCDGMLFGRMAFADPDYANEIIKNGRIDPKRVCMTCGKCGDLIRAHKPTGCVIRDPKTFMPFYKEFLEIKKKQPANFRG